MIKVWAKKLADEVGDTVLYPVSVAVDETMWEQKKLFPNADFYHASAYHFMGIPTAVHADLRLLARYRLGVPCNVRTTQQQPDHSAECRVHRSEQRKVVPIAQR